MERWGGTYGFASITKGMAHQKQERDSYGAIIQIWSYVSNYRVSHVKIKVHKYM